MLQKSSINKIVKVFFDYPTSPHYLLEISKKAKIAHTSTKNCLIKIKKEGLILETIENKGKRKFPVYHANINGSLYKLQKKIYNLENVLNSGLVEFIKEQAFPKSIVLFGSYARGEDIEDSDIDIFLETEKKELILDEFEKKLKRRIEIHFKKNFNDFPDELKNNILNGIILSGYLEVFK